MTATSPRRLALACALGLLALLGACGTGGSSSTVTEFFYQAVGPQGGTASGGPVTVVFPAGAVAEVTAVAVLPEANLLPILPSPNDPCSYDYAGTLHCVGPIDLHLLVPGALVLRYELADLPPGATPADLVVLVSDPTTGHTSMTPVPPGDVVLDTTAQTLAFGTYGVLSHVAVGVRTCPPRDLLLEDSPQQFLTAGSTGAPVAGQGPRVAGLLGLPTLWSLDSAGVTPPAPLDLGAFYAEAWVPSPSGTRLLLRGYPGGGNTPVLATVPWPAGGTPVVVLEGDALTGEDLLASDGLWGWLRGPSTDTIFGALYSAAGSVVGKPAAPQAILPGTGTRLLRRDAQGATAPVQLAARDSFSWLLDDLRQSSDGSTLAVRWGINSSNLGMLPGSVPPGMDLVTPVPVQVSSDAVPPGMGRGEPRFLQGSTDLYMIDTANAVVQRWTAAGSLVGTLFTPSAPAIDGSVFHEGFAVAPDNSTYALVTTLSPSTGGSSTLVTVGRLAGGAVTTLAYGQVGLDELVWHPSGTGVFLDLKGGEVTFLRVVVPTGQGAIAVTEQPLPADDMRTVDVHRDDGRILLTVPPGGFRQVVAGGVYVLAPDASTTQQLDTTGFVGPRNARWLRTWRTTGGQESFSVR